MLLQLFGGVNWMILRKTGARALRRRGLRAAGLRRRGRGGRARSRPPARRAGRGAPARRRWPATAPLRRARRAGPRRCWRRRPWPGGRRRSMPRFRRRRNCCRIRASASPFWRRNRPTKRRSSCRSPSENRRRFARSTGGNRPAAAGPAGGSSNRTQRDRMFFSVSGAEGLAQVIVHAGLQAFFPVAGHGVGRHGDDGHARAAALAQADLRRGLVAVLLGHVAIHEHDVVGLFFQRPQRRRAAAHDREMRDGRICRRSFAGRPG